MARAGLPSVAEVLFSRMAEVWWLGAYQRGYKEDRMSKSPATPTYVMMLRSVGNPDYAQYTSISEPRAVKAKTLRAMVRAVEEYIKEWDLGGGNFPTVEVRTMDGKSAAWISYNGRVWDSPNDDAKEIELEAVARG